MARSSDHVSSFDHAEDALRGHIAHKKLLAVETLTTTAPQIDPELIATPCVLYECGLDLIVNTISPNAYELIRIRPENILGKTALWQDRLCPVDRARLHTKLSHLPCSEFASEMHRINDDRGLPVWVAHSFRKIKVDRDTIVRGCLMPLSTADRAATLDSGVINQFVHRIGNHFQLINLLVDSLKRKVSSFDELEALQQTVDRAVGFTRSFSLYNQTPVLDASVQLSELLRSLIESWTPYFRENNVVIESAFHPSFEVATVTADRVLLDFAFGSILQNALDVTKKGERLGIEGRAERFKSRGESVARILIADRGHGMDKEEVEKAVVPFHSSKRDCDGLGLSSAVRIIELHGGVVNITSQPGRGTEVEIVLPMDDRDECSER